MKINKLLCLAFSLGIIGSVNNAFSSNQPVPKDIWKHIASYLNTNEKAKFSEVCKLFQTLVCNDLKKEKSNYEFNESYKLHCTATPTPSELVDLARQVKDINVDALMVLMFYEQAEGDPSEAIILMDKFITASTDKSMVNGVTANLKRIAKGVEAKESLSEIFNGRKGLPELTTAALKILEKYLK